MHGAQLFPWPQFMSHSEPECDSVTHTKDIMCGKVDVLYKTIF